MTIKTKIFIALLMAAVFTVAAGVTLYSSKKNVSAYYEKDNITSIILKGVFELNILTNDFLKHPLNRTLEQWNQRYNSLLKFLNNNKLLYHEELSYFKDLEQNLNALKITFSKLSEDITSGNLRIHGQGDDSKLLLYH